MPMKQTDRGANGYKTCAAIGVTLSRGIRLGYGTSQSQFLQARVCGIRGGSHAVITPYGIVDIDSTLD